MKKKVLVAFSGGLDTSFCVKYLKEEKGYDVYTALVNTGGFSPSQLEEVEKKALALGAVSHCNIDITQEFYDKAIRYMIFGNVLRGNTYPISVSSERVFQAIAIIEYAKQIGVHAVGTRFDRCRQRSGAFRHDLPDFSSRDRDHRSGA